MNDKVVFLKFSNPNAVDNGFITFVACKHCRNKTYTLTKDGMEYPMLTCAACGFHVGRIGWTD